MNVAGIHHGMIRSGHHPRRSNSRRRAAVLDGAGGALEEPLQNTRAGTLIWDEGRSHDSAKDTEGDAAEGQDKNRGDAGTEEGGERCAGGERDGCRDNAKEAVGTAAPLEPRKKGGLAPTNKKNAEANTKAYDLNQKTRQALDTLAEKYEIFEETMKKVTHETEEGDMLFAVAHEVMEELDKAQKDQDRLHDEMEVTCESMVAASQGVHNLLGEL